MLTLITGQPGAGKTLYMLTAVKEQADKEKRPVYFASVTGLNTDKLDWIGLDDPKDWHKVPDGAIVVIDECQSMWRTRGVGAQVPDYVSAMETHRHRGLDVWATTQHPMLIDSNIRRLVGRHLHVMRAFGLHKATVHEWNVLRAEPDKSRVDSIRHDFIYPKSSFDLYKSAEIHTHKRRVPLRVLVLIVGPFVLAGLGYGVYKIMRPYATGENLAKAPAVASSSPFASSGYSPAAQGRPKAMTEREYVDSMTPRIHGLAYTASAYDDVTKPARAPYPAAAVLVGGKCRAYTSQATRLDMPDETCRSIVARGFFMAWDEKIPPTVLQQLPKVATASIQPQGDAQRLPEGLGTSQPEIASPAAPAAPSADPFTSSQVVVRRRP